MTLAVALAAAAIVAGLAYLAWGRLARAITRLAADTVLIATVNPSLRPAPTGPAPLRALTEAVNQLADRYQREQSDVTARIAEANRDLERERTRLAVLMSELTVAVLVCTIDGRILLYNAAARQLLETGEGGWNTQVGLGRSVFTILDSSMVTYALERLETSGAASSHPVATMHRGRLLRAQIAPVRVGDDDASGFVVTLEDMTRLAETTQARQGLITSMTQATRSAVGNIRAAVENVLSYPDMTAEQRSLFLGVISEEATGLGRRLTEALDAGPTTEDSWLVADLQAGDLMDAVARSLHRLGFEVTLEQPSDAVWLTADGFALQRVVGGWAERLREQQDVSALGLRIGDAGRLVALDLTWHGAAVDTPTLRAWTVEDSDAGDGKDAITRHGGEVWSGTDGKAAKPSEGDDGGDEAVAYIRMLLPRSQAQEPPEADAHARPDRDWLASYDFSLLTPTGSDLGWADQPLAELSYTVFDTETTGLYPNDGDEIISLGAVRIVNGRLLRSETFDQFVDPGRPIPQASIDVHGITPEELIGKPSIAEVLPTFVTYAADTVLVGHNVAFDLQFLKHKREHTGDLLRQPALDTLLLAVVAYPDEERHTLELMADKLGVTVTDRHSALGDALVTGEVLLKLLQVLADRGITTLAQARAAAEQTYRTQVSEAVYSRQD
ncbi:MAG: DNA polymerase III subunit epsilon [Kineosporiaceae bacterium]|nr:DNA polymerase III subunit epsilon [Kineosporiaceae bacterium]